MVERLSDAMRYGTVRILTSAEITSRWSGCGTGFFYAALNGDQSAPMLVTNKHVLQGARVIGLNFHEKDAYDQPIPGRGRLLAIEKESLPILEHPDPMVDLAAIALAPIIEASEGEGWRPYIKCLTKANFPTSEIIDDIGAISELIMVGYPTGVVDEYNNFPIVRRGLTATPYKTDYQGNREFLMDIAVYPGSSGSPVFLLNEGAVSTAKGLSIGNRFALMGILRAGHTQTLDGNIVIRNVPTEFNAIAQTTQMINLGICIKSVLIEEMAAQIRWN